MLKKFLASFLVAFTMISTTSLATTTSVSEVINKNKLDNGIISVNYNKDSKIKVMISKDNKKYSYNLNNQSIQIPLQLGNGQYNVFILENIEGNKYKVLSKENIKLQLQDQNKVYLQSIQLINWNNDMNAIKKAKELTQYCKDDEEKVMAIYNYVINNIDYDYNKAKTVKTGYVPCIDEVIKNSKGICYDYSSLFAGMLRSVGVPTKLVMGYKNDIKTYHAWNQVYLQKSNKWVTIDTTYDSCLKNKNLSLSMIKDSNQYKVSKEY
mgnify:FL=1